MIGTTLSHFEITAKLGEGGMGEVYRATDTRLGREVAIKVLPESFAADGERLARFAREARVLAALDHPNIAGIYEVGEDGGQHFLALELAAGESLADRLRRGPFAIGEAVPIALQVAAAVEAAHARGIVHRDLKPANIHVSDEGRVRVLDFGLAKAMAATPEAAPDLTHSPTLTRHATAAGVLLGTASYMSPEQARGLEADERSDIWAFGVVLFEMLSGRKPFDGDTVSDRLAAVLRAEIPIGELAASLPTPLRRLLRRCLERDPSRRLQHIGDARLELEDVVASPHRDLDVAAGEASSSGVPVATRLLAAVAAAALAVAVWALLGRDAEPATEVRRSLIRTEPLYSVSPPVISPDGRMGVYSTGDRLGMWHLDRFEHTFWEGDHAHPFFSPDSRHLAFELDGAIWRMELASGERRLITAMPANNLSGGVWSDDGEITFLTWFPQALYRVPANGGEPEEIGGPFEVARELAGALPDGRGLLFVDFTDGGIDVLAGGEWTSVLAGEDIVWVAWAPSGHLVYHRPEDGLWAIPFSLDSLQPTGGPIQLDPVGTWPTLSAAGRLSYKHGLDRARFVLLDRTGRLTGRIGRGQFMLQDPAVSPDGRSVTGVSREQGSFAVWLHDTGSERARRLTFDLEPSLGSAAWHPDGRHLFFAAGDEIWRLDLEGDEPPQAVARGWAAHVSADGRYLAFVRLAAAEATGDTTSQEAGAILYLDLTGDGEPAVFVEGDSSYSRPRFSPDGRYLAYVSNASGRDEVYVRRFPSAAGPWQISADGGAQPRWSPAGDELYYLRERDLMAVAVALDDSFRPGTSSRLFTLASPSFYEYAVTRDGLFVAVDPGEETSEIALVDGWQRSTRALDR